MVVIVTIVVVVLETVTHVVVVMVLVTVALVMVLVLVHVTETAGIQLSTHVQDVIQLHIVRLVARLLVVVDITIVHLMDGILPVLVAFS